MGMSKEAPDMIRGAFENAYRQFPLQGSAAHFGAGILKVVREGWATLDAIAGWNDLRGIRTSKGMQRQHFYLAVDSATDANRSIGVTVPRARLETTILELWESLRRNAVLGIIGAAVAVQFDSTQTLAPDTLGLGATAQMLLDSHQRRRPVTIFDRCAEALQGESGAALRLAYANALTGYTSDQFPNAASDPVEFNGLLLQHMATLLQVRLYTSGFAPEFTEATVHNLTLPEQTSTT